MSSVVFQTSTFGSNPFTVDTASTSGSGIIMPQFKLGHVVWGDAGAEWVYCSFTPGSNVTLTPGLLFTVSADWVASLLTTANSPRGTKVMVSTVGLAGNPSASLTSGVTYYLWLLRSGNAPIAYSTVATLGNLGETTATNGTANFPNSATVSSKLITALYVTKAVATTFSGTTTNGSAVVTVASGVLTRETGPIWVGSGVSGTGIPGSTTVAAINENAQGQIISFTMSANATASGTVTITPSGIAEGNLMWPYIDKTN